MKYEIKKTDKTSAYIQLYKQVREDIINGIYPYNTKLPSKRITAEELGISTVTVEHAYSLLCDEGYIEPMERSGYFVIFRTTDGFVSSQKYAKHIYPTVQHHDTSVEFPFSVLAKTMRTVISNMKESVLDRSENFGTYQLRTAIKEYLARNRGITADIEQIVIGSGSEYLYNLIVVLLGRDKTFAIESPSYKKIEQVYSVSGVKLQKLPLLNDGIDSNALKSCNADVLHISPYRSYPSGVSADISKRHEYLRWSKHFDRFIIEDDFESEFSVSQKFEETLFSQSGQDNVIYMNTFSKTVSPSLRVGYMVLPKCLIEKFKTTLGFYSCTVPTYIQYVLAELITSGDFERHINRVRRAKRKEIAKLQTKDKI